MRLSVRVALTPPDTHEWRNWKTSQAKNLVSKRRAGSNPASCTTMEPEAQWAGAPGCGPEVSVRSRPFSPYAQMMEW